MGEFYKEGVYEHGLGYDAKTVKATSEYLFTNGLNLVVEDEGEIVGLMSGVVVPFFMNANAKVWQEIIYYIKPEKRVGTIGLRLFKEMERYAKDKGCTHCLMAHLCNINSDRMSKLYGRQGYSPMEIQFLKKL